MTNNIMQKQGLSNEQLFMVQAELESKGKNKVLTYVLWWFLGPFAAHRFYLGDTGYAICMLLFGWCTLFIWNIVDVFFIGKRLEEANGKIERNAIEQVKLFTV